MKQQHQEDKGTQQKGQRERYGDPSMEHLTEDQKMERVWAKQ